MSVPKPLGLALSGGGFRAAAFHLGVLKRLRELKLLEQVDVVSTVSGGSITGTYWVYWQAKRGDATHDDDEWDRFESSLVQFMRAGVREWVLWRGFWVPFLILITVTAILGWYFRESWNFLPANLRIVAVVAIVAAEAALSYVSWHYRASRLFERRLDRELFKKSTLIDLSPPSRWETVPWPHLFANATGLSSGDYLLFTPQPSPGTTGWNLLLKILPNTTGIPQSAKKRPRSQPRDAAPRVSMALKTRLARAVAASCAIPSVFAPLRFDDTEPWWELPSWWPGKFQAVDGGVNDNQGTGVLLDGHCPGIIVSDASGALRTVPSPSTWQVFPPGKGVIFRSQNIIYERMRDLGYKRLEERFEFSRRLSEAGLLQSEDLRYLPVLNGYAYVELWPSDSFGWSTNVRLPETLVSFVSSIRTDLDKFSAIEISALMFHGYTIIDHCIRAYQPEWLPEQSAPLRFSSRVAAICINWEGLTAQERVDYVSHLAVSDSRVGFYRPLRRAWFRWKYRKAPA